MDISLSRSLALLFLALGSIASAQDTALYPVGLEVSDGRLTFVTDSNCENGRPPGEICVGGEHAAEIVFSLGASAGDWAFSGMRIRDPAANWNDALPPHALASFPQFDRNGAYRATENGDGTMTIRSTNRHELAVQYGVTVVNRRSGEEPGPIHGVIDVDGSAAAQQD